MAVGLEVTNKSYTNVLNEREDLQSTKHQRNKPLENKRAVGRKESNYPFS